MAYVLNIDVLHHIMFFLDRMSISRLMRTCRTLNHEGARHLFRDHPWVKDEAGATSLTQYATARANVDETAYRMQWLRGLHLCAPWTWTRHPAAESCQRFAQIMTSFLSRCAIYAPNLVELELSGSEELFAAHPALMRAVGTMACLRKLRLWNAGPQAFGMLRQSHFRLRHAEICGLHEQPPQPPQPSVKDNPIFALYHSRDTLRVLTLENVPFDSDHHMPCYKNVDELTLSSSLVPPVHRLAQNFPNLRVLTVPTYPGYYYLNPAEREEQLQASILRQEQRGTFRALDSYSGSILSLYVFGLTCRIPYVSLRDDEDELCWDASMLQAVCAKARPAHLVLYICSVGTFLSQVEDFVHLCASADFRGVRTLSVTFDVWWARDLDLACVVECIYSAVRSSSLRAVELVFDWRGFWEDCNEDVDPDFPPPAETFLRSVDLDVVADELLETTERLETAVVRLRILGQPEVTTQRGPDIDYDDDD